MTVLELLKILWYLPQEAEISVEASPSKKYDRTSDIKLCKIGKKEFLLTDKDSDIYKQKSIEWVTYNDK